MYQFRNRTSLVIGVLVAAALLPGTAARAASEKVLYSFCSQANCADGEAPTAGLIELKGLLYGTTYGGGSGSCNAVYYTGCGTAFSLDPNSGTETVLYSFCSQFNCPDGSFPSGGLIDVKGTLYGTTTSGGTDIGGTVFSLDPQSGAETVLHSFCRNCGDGSEPLGSLISVKDKLYGTTNYGGESNDGSLFSLDTKSGVETVLYSFCSQVSCADGNFPKAGLIDVNGTLYGTTYMGGSGQGIGAVFAFEPKTGVEKVVYSFCSQANCTDGSFPAGSLLDLDGTLYGTTSDGGANQGGTVFSLDPKTGVEKVLYSFCGKQNCADGDDPATGLIYARGKLYGTTNLGGSGVHECGANFGYGCGTVFSLDLNSGKEKVLYSLCSDQNCTDGEDPEANLVDVKGTLFGTTFLGGSGKCATYGTIGCGAVFSLESK